MDNNQIIELDQGGGGLKSNELIKDFRQILNFSDKKWQGQDDDGAFTNLGNLIRLNNKNKINQHKNSQLVFTTDAFIVDPLFFPGGDIGKIAMCGTINDLCMMGAQPLAISLSLIIEEGFSREDLKKIMRSINKVSEEAKVSVVTGDTKVQEKGKLDKIAITTAGVGLAPKIISDSGIKAGDLIIASGNLGDHAVALLSKRFDYETKIKSDSKPLDQEIEKVGKYLHALKDPTRGGLGANLVEMAEKSKVKVILDENNLPYNKESLALADLLGIDVFSFASEGRFVASIHPRNKDKVLNLLTKFNKSAKVIGKAEKGRGVFLKTKYNTLRRIEMPRGKLIPRIC